MKLEMNPDVSYSVTKEEVNQEIERWMAEKRKHIGEEWPLEVGKKWFGLKNRLVTVDLIRNFCNTVGDLNPLYRDEAYARSTKYGGIIAPPLILEYLTYISGGVGVEPPSMSSRGGRPRIHGITGLNMEGKVTWLRTIRPGEEFHCVDKFLGVEEVTKKEKPVPRRFHVWGHRHF